MRNFFLIYRNNKGSIVIYLLILISLLFFLVFRSIFYSKLNYMLVKNEINNQRIGEKLKLVTDIIFNLMTKKELYGSFFEEGFEKYYSKRRILKIGNEKFYILLESERNKVNLNKVNDNEIKEAIFDNLKDNFTTEYLDSISDKILD